MRVQHLIRVPKTVADPVKLDEVLVFLGDRVRKHQVLAYLNTARERVPLVSPANGWIKQASIANQSLKKGALLFVVDAFAYEDFQVDPNEVNGATELGESGRRGLEREGHRRFAKGFQAPLFEAQQGNHSTLSHFGKPHPLLSFAKEGVPPKMSAHVAENSDAQLQFSEELESRPELQKQLGNELKHQLCDRPSAAPTLRV